MKLKSFFLDYLPMVITATLILYTSVANHQTILKTLPTLITLVVLLLSAKANRFAFLLGGLNSILYGISYLSEGIYFSVISALAISFPIQIYSFFRWKRVEKNNTPVIRFLGAKRLSITVASLLVLWLLICLFLAPLFEDAAYPSLDAFVFVCGLIVSLLAARGFADSQYINSVSCLVHLVLWILLTVQAPSNFNYIIISAYNLFRVIQAAIHWTKLYRKNKKIAV